MQNSKLRMRQSMNLGRICLIFVVAMYIVLSLIMFGSFIVLHWGRGGVKSLKSGFCRTSVHRGYLMPSPWSCFFIKTLR